MDPGDRANSRRTDEILRANTVSRFYSPSRHDTVGLRGCVEVQALGQEDGRSPDANSVPNTLP